MEAYLDNAATTKVDPRVAEKMLSFLTETYGNPSSAHCFGEKARSAVEEARARVARLLNCSAEEIHFTSGATESNNHVLKALANQSRQKSPHFIVSQVEHKCILETCAFLERQGVRVTYLPVGEDGCVSTAEVLNAIEPETMLISVMLVNNETGAIQPVDMIAEVISNQDIVFHSDCVQGVARLPVDVQKLGVDVLSLSAHKIHGPKGIGCLFIRKGTEIAPFIHGGPQERGIRAGTENVPGIVGLGEACRIALKERKTTYEHCENMRRIILESLHETVDFKLNGDAARTAPHILNISLSGLKGDTLALALSLKGIAVSTGSACGTKSQKLSYVLKAMNLSDERIRGAIRISLSRFTKKEEIDYFVSELEASADRLAIPVQ